MNAIKFLISAFVICFSINLIKAQTTTTSAPPPPPPPRPEAMKDAAKDAAKDAIDKARDIIRRQEQLPANSIIRGRVYYADTGRPVKRSPIMLMTSDGRGGPNSSPSGLTDSQGFFEIKNVKAGTYYAMVNAPGVVSPLAYANLSRLGRGGGNEREALAKAFEGFDKIVVNGITDIEVQIPAIRGGAISGRVMYENGDSAIGVQVEVLRKVDEKFIPVIPNFSSIFSLITSGGYKTDDRGMYRFAGLPAGDYTVKVTENVSHANFSQNRYMPPGLGLGSTNSFLSMFFPNVYNAKAAEPIRLELGQELSETNLIIPTRTLYKAEGKIVSRKDKKAVKARIGVKRVGEENVFSFLQEISREQRKSSTDENGNWKFKELPKGKYILTVEAISDESEYGYGNYNITGVDNINVGNNSPPKPTYAKKVKELIIEDENLDNIVIELGYGATVSGTVSVENNQKMPESVVISTYLEQDEIAATGSVNNYEYKDKARNKKINRTFNIKNVIEGKNKFLIRVANKSYYVESATVNGRDLLAGTINLKEGESLRGVKVVLSKKTGTIKGVVLDEDKKPLKGESFSLVPTDAVKRRNSSYYRKVKTNQKGEFETQVAPYEYAVVFFEDNIGSKSNDEFNKWLDDAIKDAKKVKVDAGDTEKVTIKTISVENPDK